MTLFWPEIRAQHANLRIIQIAENWKGAMLSNQRILFLGAHPDDLEFAAGGLITQIATSQSSDIRIAIFSNCNDSLPAKFAQGTLIAEFHRSMQLLGVTSDKIIERYFPVREFSAHRQEILQNLIDIKNDFAPTCVFAPSRDDIHQDHSTLGIEALRAFKQTNYFDYTHPWNSVEKVQNSFLEITKSQLEKKIQAIRCYQTQANRSYSRDESISGMASFYGSQSGFEYAEAFTCIRLRIRNS